MPAHLLDDPLVRKAVSRIPLRSERQENPDQLVATFVDPGISVQLENDNNQILYGRRGTGKTHVLKIVQRHLAAEPARLPIYIDMRTLGSSSIFTDEDRPQHVRVTSLLKDVLSPLHDELRTYATQATQDLPGNVFECLDRFASAITRSVLTDESINVEAHRGDQQQIAGDAALSLGPTGPAASIGGRTERSTDAHRTTAREGKPLANVLFRELADTLDAVVDAAGLARVVLLLDEWTAIPPDLQPLLAEFLKRTLFPNPKLVVKIASLEYRSNFSEPLGGNNLLGFELGADISSALELDDYFVYDRNSERTIDIFAELLYRHISAEAELEYISKELLAEDSMPQNRQDALRSVMQRIDWQPRHLRQEHGVASATSLTTALFASRDAFKELVRAGEGVARDFINIFSSAFFDAVRRGSSKIDMRAVREAAREWYEKDKSQSIDSQQANFLRFIIDEVIGKKKARSFLLEKQYEEHEVIRSLFDFRLLHLVQRGYADKDNPGLRYNIYTLDYGTYVDLIGTQKAPTFDFSEMSNGDDPEDLIVPFDDKRSIRRIILRPDDLIRVGNGGMSSTDHGA